MGEAIHPGGDYKKYFDLVFWHEGQEDEKFMSGIEQADVINREIQLCGYFVIVTSAKMTADNIHRQARGISTDLARIEAEAFEKQADERKEWSV